MKIHSRHMYNFLVLIKKKVCICNNLFHLQKIFYNELGRVSDIFSILFIFVVAFPFYINILVISFDIIFFCIIFFNFCQISATTFIYSNCTGLHIVCVVSSG